MRLRISVPAQLGLFALLLLSIFAWAPALVPGYWEALEGFVPVFNVSQPAPFAAVATAPDIWRSAGGATFLLPRAFVLIGFEPSAAVRGAYIVAFLLGSCGIYAWLRPRLGDLAAGMAGLIYILLPIFLATVYVRGSLADALVLGFLPLTFAGLAAYERQRSLVGAAVAVLTIVWIWRTQAGLAVFATLLLLIYALAVERNWVTLLIAGVAAAAGIVSLISDFNIVAPAPTNFYDQFVYLHQLFAVDWFTAPSDAGWQDTYPFQLGFAAFAFSVIALWIWWRRRPRPLPEVERLLAFAWIGAIILVLLTFGFSEPLWRVTGAGRLLTYPWQLMILAAPLIAVTAGALPALARA
ncbi:MAG: hypothetical protein IPK16_27345 [Anaerolineales bacterium]|nr:hypothetical protein [Anaerolineales bacterium]